MGARLLSAEKINQRSDKEEKSTPLMVAIRNQKDLRCIQVWLDYFPDYKAKDERGRNVLHLVIEGKNHIELVPIFLKACPELVNIPSCIPPFQVGQHPIHLAAAVNSIGIMTTLGKAGADIHARDADVNMALHLAARMGNLESIVFLLNNGANLLNRIGLPLLLLIFPS